MKTSAKRGALTLVVLSPALLTLSGCSSSDANCNSVSNSGCNSGSRGTGSSYVGSGFRSGSSSTDSASARGGFGESGHAFGGVHGGFGGGE